MSISFGSTTGGVVIHQFNTSNNSVKRGEPFTLSWNVEGADKIELYRNGALFQTPGVMQTSVERTEFYDSQKEVKYELIAYRQGTQVRSRPVIIKFYVPGAPAAPVANDDTMKLLLKSAMWAKFIAIAGIVLLSLLVLVAMTLGVNGKEEAAPTSIIAVLVIAISLAPLILLLSFANKTYRTLENKNSSDLSGPLRYLKLYFQVMGITLIVLMLVSIISFLSNLK